MASIEKMVESPELGNWLKAFIAMCLTKVGLETFVHDDLKQYVKDLLQSIYSCHNVKEGTICNSCTTFNITPCPSHGFCRRKSGICQVHDETVPEKKSLGNCPLGICHHIREALHESHRYAPNWTNTDATRWCTNLNEIAKCFLADGYKDKGDLDLNAIISVIVNKKSFGPKMTAQLSSKKEEENIFRKVLRMGNEIRHSPNLNISDKELKDYINTLIDMLSDSTCLARNENAVDVVNQLKMLLTDTLIISKEQRNEAFEDVMEVLNQNGKISEDSCGNEDTITELADHKHKIDASKDASDKDTHENIPTDTSRTIMLSTENTDDKMLDQLPDDTEENFSQNLSKRKVSTDHVPHEVVSSTNDTDSELSSNIPLKLGSSSKDTDEDHSENVPCMEDDALSTTVLYLRQRPSSIIPDEKKNKLVQIFNEMKNELADRGSVPISDIDTILAAKLNALEEIRQAKEENLLELNKRKEEIQSEIRLGRGFKEFLPRSRLYKGLRQDLSTFYRSRYSTISISPLVLEHDVPLVDLYVQPTLEYVDITTTLEGAPADLKIHSYEDLFFCETANYKEIYITAKAGIGKTSFVKRICMTWCQAHFPLKEFENSFSVNDIKTLKKFDFLFMIPLKETKNAECNIDGMILHLVENHMKSKGRYAESFIDDILRKKRVLVILDGLDEWAHPENCQQKSEVIPHRRPCSNCSVITTTRPWKLASAKLMNSQINMHAELLEFDDASSNKLVVSAVNLLTKIYKRSKSAADFPKEVSLNLLGALRFIPYILLQVICLWYDGLSIGKSQCQIYSNALELTLSRENSFESSWSVENHSAPKCLSQNINCMALYDNMLLIKVGKLAYEALYSSTNESTLLFDEDIVKQYLSEDVLQFILKKGLLSQNKDTSKVANWKTYFSFQHKSIQEYFAALYIQALPGNIDEIAEKIAQRHTTLESVLEMSNVFIFLGGFNPEVCSRLLQIVKKILSSDEICYQYRNYLSGRTSSPEKRKCWEIMKSFQNMQIDILQEVFRNDTCDCHLYLEDLILDGSFNIEMLNLLKVIVCENMENLKSISIEECPSTQDITEKFRMFQLQSSKKLQKLDVTAVPSEDDLQHLLSNSEKTIVSLDLCFAIFKGNRYKTVYTKLAKDTILRVLHMENLQSVRLNSIILPHTDIENLVKCIQEKKTMTEVGLCHIRCSQHEECVMLDLSEHEYLETLRIGTIPVTLLKVNVSSLKFCYTGELTTAVHVELAQRLTTAVHLKTLRLKFLSAHQSTIYTSEALGKMNHLKSFAVEIADFENNELIIPCGMSNLERVQFYQVKMKARVLKKFIESVTTLRQAVVVIIDDCDIEPSIWYNFKGIKGTIRKNYQNYRVLFDRGNTFSFLTRK